MRYVPLQLEMNQPSGLQCHDMEHDTSPIHHRGGRNTFYISGHVQSPSADAFLLYQQLSCSIPPASGMLNLAPPRAATQHLKALRLQRDLRRALGTPRKTEKPKPRSGGKANGHKHSGKGCAELPQGQAGGVLVPLCTAPAICQQQLFVTPCCPLWEQSFNKKKRQSHCCPELLQAAFPWDCVLEGQAKSTQCEAALSRGRRGDFCGTNSSRGLGRGSRKLFDAGCKKK